MQSSPLKSFRLIGLFSQSPSGQSALTSKTWPYKLGTLYVLTSVKRARVKATIEGQTNDTALWSRDTKSINYPTRRSSPLLLALLLTDVLLRRRGSELGQRVEPVAEMVAVVVGGVFGDSVPGHATAPNHAPVAQVQRFVAVENAGEAQTALILVTSKPAMIGHDCKRYNEIENAISQSASFIFLIKCTYVCVCINLSTRWCIVDSHEFQFDHRENSSCMKPSTWMNDICSYGGCKI